MLGTAPARSARWVPSVLSPFEVGQAVAAIEAVQRLEKPLAEVGCRPAILASLEDDLRGCLRLAEAKDVKLWTRECDGAFRFGFYREAWVLDAINFLDRADLSVTDRAWISGLVFGYRSSAIQDFIDKTTPSVARR